MGLKNRCVKIGSSAYKKMLKQKITPMKPRRGSVVDFIQLTKNPRIPSPPPKSLRIPSPPPRVIPSPPPKFMRIPSPPPRVIPSPPPKFMRIPSPPPRVIPSPPPRVIPSPPPKWGPVQETDPVVDEITTKLNTAIKELKHNNNKYGQKFYNGLSRIVAEIEKDTLETKSQDLNAALSYMNDIFNQLGLTVHFGDPNKYTFNDHQRLIIRALILYIWNNYLVNRLLPKEKTPEGFPKHLTGGRKKKIAKKALKKKSPKKTKKSPKKTKKTKKTTQ
jgi:hypothetical protein